MLAFASTLMFAALPVPLQEAESWRVEGRCTYPPALVEEADAAILVPCGEAVLTAEGITLAARGFAPQLMFAGNWDGDALTITQVTRRGAEGPDAARGFCRLQWREDELSALVCSVIAGPRSYVVNFLVPNI